VDKRIFGLRNEYSVVFSVFSVFSADGQRQLSPEEMRHRLFGPVASGSLGRTVINTRDEAHPAAAGLRRLRVTISDPT
jgi:hypothetical protein